MSALKMNHLCGSGCLDDVRVALQKLPWVGVISIPDEASAARPGEQHGRKRRQQLLQLVDVTVKAI